MPRLFEAAKGTVVEIGTRAGYSTSALLAGVEKNGGKLFSVDIRECLPDIKHPQWMFICCDSVKNVETLRHALPDTIDVLLVDGDHTYEGCLSDLENFGCRAKKIFVHDTDAPAYPDVKVATLQFCANHERDVVFHDKSFGMAEINGKVVTHRA